MESQNAGLDRISWVVPSTINWIPTQTSRKPMIRPMAFMPVAPKARTTQAEACKTSHDNGQVLAHSVAIPMVTGPLSMAWPAE